LPSSSHAVLPNRIARDVIQLRMTVTDVERLQFGYSPIVEAVESLRMVLSGAIRSPYRDWFAEIGPGLRRLDLGLLRALLPEGPAIADFLFGGPPRVRFDEQVRDIAECEPDRMRADLLSAWRGGPPLVVRELLADPSAGARRIADELHRYWSLAIEPFWWRIQAVLRADVAYRANRVAAGGIDAMLSDLHPELSVAATALLIDKPHHRVDRALGGTGVRFVPSVFVWPGLIVSGRPDERPDITYGCRGVGTIWNGPEPRPADRLGALLGRTRAAILVALGQPRCTSELAVALGQSAPSVSTHLTVLRRAGMVTSWRSGRRMMHQRSALATAMVTAGGDTIVDSDTRERGQLMDS
jgi:DNA-binding transcriptional ArsR family regulator